jgi:hypothetical protein
MTVRRVLFLSVLTCVLVAGTTAARAQEAPESEDAGRLRLGPIRFTPSVQVTNFGIDTNVFNEFDDPKQDFTIGLGPAVDFWVRLGRARVTGKAGLDYNYFKEYESQRYVGTASKVRLTVPLARIAPFVEGGYANTRQRPGYEIDARAKRTTAEGRGGIDVRLGSRTLLTLAAARTQGRFGSDEEFLGQALSRALDNDSDTVDLTFARHLTPLTTFVVTAQQRRDRFVYATERHSDALKVVSGFNFKPFALISGTIRVGWREFETLDPSIPDYSGPTATGELAYAVRATRASVVLGRDVEYSYHERQPYYLLTDLRVEVTQRLTARWDVVGRTSRALLDYRAVGLAGEGPANERHRRVGGGVGYRVGDLLRLGLDVNNDRRTSELVTRQYQAWRVGGSVTYGLKTP